LIDTILPSQFRSSSSSYSDWFGDEYFSTLLLRNLVSCIHLYSPFTPSYFALRPISFLNAGDQVSHSDTTTGKILVLFVRVIPNITIKCVSKMRSFSQSCSIPKSLFANSKVHKYVALRPISFLNAGDQVSHPNKTTGKILVLFVRVIPNIPTKCMSKLRSFSQFRSIPKSLFTNSKVHMFHAPSLTGK
jgi:hypothetical protein